MRQSVLPTLLATAVWKFKGFSVIQILREINFKESRSSKTAVFAILGAVKFVGWPVG